MSQNQRSTQDILREILGNDPFLWARYVDIVYFGPEARSNRNFSNGQYSFRQNGIFARYLNAAFFSLFFNGYKHFFLKQRTFKTFIDVSSNLAHRNNTSADHERPPKQHPTPKPIRSHLSNENARANKRLPPRTWTPQPHRQTVTPMVFH